MGYFCYEKQGWFGKRFDEGYKCDKCGKIVKKYIKSKGGFRGNPEMNSLYYVYEPSWHPLTADASYYRPLVLCQRCFVDWWMGKRYLSEQKG